MRKLIIIAAVAAAAVSSFGASKAATEAWVTNKIAGVEQKIDSHIFDYNATNLIIRFAAKVQSATPTNGAPRVVALKMEDGKLVIIDENGGVYFFTQSGGN